jgi:hypothetical protein
LGLEASLNPRGRPRRKEKSRMSPFLIRLRSWQAPPSPTFRLHPISSKAIDICMPYAYDARISRRGCSCGRPWISTRNSFVN